jgi:hypothetical protein
MIKVARREGLWKYTERRRSYIGEMSGRMQIIGVQGDFNKGKGYEKKLTTKRKRRGDKRRRVESKQGSGRQLG